MAMDMLAPGAPIKELEETGAKADEETKGTSGTKRTNSTAARMSASDP